MHFSGFSLGVLKILDFVPFSGSLGHYINLLGFKVWKSDMGLCLAKVRVSMEINYFIFLHIIATDYSFLFVYGEAWNSGFLLFFLFLDTANGKKLLDSRENGSLLMGFGSLKVLRGVKN